MSYTFNAFSFVSANEVNVLQDRKTIRKRFFSSYLMKIYKSTERVKNMPLRQTT